MRRSWPVVLGLIAACAFPSGAGAAEKEPPVVRFAASSDNGERAFFLTDMALSRADTDNSIDIYRHSGGRTALMTGGPRETSGEFPASFGAISSDGARLIFSTAQRMVATDADDGFDVYVTSGRGFRILSLGAILGGTGETVQFLDADPSASRVLMQSNEQLVQGDNDDSDDLYLSAPSGPRLLTRGADASEVEFAGATEDARRVFFLSRAKLVAEDGDLRPDIYAGTVKGVTLVTVRIPVEGGERRFSSPRFRGVSSDGSRVIFETVEQLLPGDRDREYDVYASTPARTTLLSTDAIGSVEHASQVPSASAISRDATEVLVDTEGRLLPGDNDKGLRDIYRVRDGRPSLLSTGPRDLSLAGESHFAGATDDLRRVYFATTNALVSSDRDRARDFYEVGSRVRLITAGRDSEGRSDWDASFLGGAVDGSSVYFVTGASLTEADTNTGADIYRQTGRALTPLTLPRLSGPMTGVDDYFEPPDELTPRRASEDGQTYFFETTKRLLPGDRDEFNDLYAAEGDRLELISRP